jgi:hypothetical protein
MTSQDYRVKAMRPVDRFEENTARIQMVEEKSIELAQRRRCPDFPRVLHRG